MLRYRRGFYFALCLALSVCACSATPGDYAGAGRIDQGALLTASCSGCHAAGGRQRGIVSLQGMTAAALEARLTAYRDDPSGGSAMHRMARGYTPQQIALIAKTLGK